MKLELIYNAKRCGDQLIKRIFFFALLLFSVGILSAEDPTIRDLQGNAVSINDYRGKVLVLNFWATWCVPCREEMPLFVDLQTKYADSDVQFIAASLDAAEDLPKVKSFQREFHLNFPVWTGASIDFQASFGLGTSLPATAIFDRNGNLCFRIIGKSSRSDLEKRIRFLISTQSDSRPSSIVLPPGITKEHFEQFHAHGDVGEEHTHSHEVGSEVPS